MLRFLERVNLRWLTCLFWLAFAGTGTLLTLQSGGIALDTDGAMRLSELRDLLHGQSWFDTTQWRMDTPFGLPMHWSRLVDGPLAAIVLVLHPFFGAAAETMAEYIWPALLFLALLGALARIADRLGGRGAALAALFLGLTAVEILGLFAPGAIDHHNLQLALGLWLADFLIEEKFAAAAIAMVASLGVGIETLPYAALAILIAAISWVRSGEAIIARRFGLTVAGCALALLFGATAARYRFAGACDTYSLFYATPLVVGGLGLTALSVPRFTPKTRAAALAALAVVTVLLAALVNPECLKGPYAQMAPRLTSIFLARINEARPAFSFAHFAPSEFIAGYCYAAACLIASLAALRGRGRILILFAAAGLAAASAEIREAPFAIAFALPGLALFLSRFASRHNTVAAIAALVLGSDISFALAGSWIEGSGQKARIDAFEAQENCASSEGIAPLARLPVGRVAGFVDQGPAILAYTPDSAIAGPYHRDADGILDSYAIFTGAPDAAAAILKRRGIAYLMVCTAAPDWNYYRQQTPDGLLALMAEGRAPSWLVPAGMDSTGDVRVYKVDFRR